MQLRLFRILWGPTLETVLDFVTPVAGDSPRIWRKPRAESERLDAGTASDALITGRDYYLSVVAKWFGLAQQTGATGLQAFIDWANDGNAFTLVPSTDTPTLTVPGCFLEAPVLDPSWSAEKDATMTVELVIRHPTQDLGLAWRGLFFEYVAGQSLTDPVAYTFARAGTTYEAGPDGYLDQLAAGVLSDGHYPDGLVNDFQAAVLQMAVANDVTNPEALGSWTPTELTITANKALAPDQNMTADLMVESVTVGVGHSLVSNAWTVTAGDVVTAVAFVRDSGRFRGRLYITEATATDRTGLDYNLLTGTIVPISANAGVTQASAIVPLGGGWFFLWWRGTVNGTSTSLKMIHTLMDGTGATVYTGDGASGTYLWGATAVHGGANIVGRYAAAVADKLTAPYTPAVQAMWLYVSMAEMGVAWDTTNNSKGALMLGTTMRLMLFKEGTGIGYRALFDNGAGAQVRSPVGNALQPNVGDRLEAFIILYGDGSVECHQAINGGAPTLYARSAADAPTVTQFGSIAFGTARPSDQVADGVIGINRVKIGPFVATGAAAVATIAAARDV